MKSLAFHNSSNYDFQTFSVPIEKIHKDGNESVVTVSYKIKFFESARFMASSLSNLVDNLAEGTHKIICKDCNCFLEFQSVKDNSIKYKAYLSIKII